MEIFLGAAVSLIVQFLKKKFGSKTTETMLFVLIMSICAASFYVLLVDTSIWPTIVQIFVAAGAFYAFVIKRFDEQ